MLPILPQKLAQVDLVTSECFDCGDIFGHGRFQRCLFVLTMASVCAMHCHTLVFRLISGDVDHWCKQPRGEGMMSAASWRNAAIPIDPDGRFSRCTVYKHPDDPNDTRVVSCDEWDYDPERQKSTIVSQWDLVCDRQPLLVVAQAVSILGSLIFMSGVGLVADHFGRLPVLLSSVVALQLATLGSSFAASYSVYVLSSFLNSGCVATVMVLSSTLLFEASTHRRRSLHLFVAMSAGMLTAEGWFVFARLLRQLRQVDWIVLQIVMLLPTVLTLYAFAAAYESPRWHVANKDMAGAEMIMLSAAKKNHFPLITTACMLVRLNEEVALSAARLMVTGGDVAGARDLRHRALVMFCSSFAVTFTMFAVQLLETEAPSGTNSWLQLAPIGVKIVGFALLLVAVRMTTAPHLLVSTLGALGGTSCLISLTFPWKRDLITSVLFLLAKPLVHGCDVIIFTTAMNVGGAAVRCVTICWLFGFGRLGGAWAATLLTVLDVGHGDVVFALAGTVLFAVMLAQLRLPPMHEVLILSSTDPASKNIAGVEFMKHTLDTPSYRKESRSKSRTSSLSSRGPGSEFYTTESY
ncbi:hypothetical protein V5799_029275 [Amblyomma americanum]|uniref:Uncharacterized protein n=1 Tax=Amblyomma americanum TaxID=6943 RepID=A0AAQ4ESA0_AMBAM